LHLNHARDTINRYCRIISQAVTRYERQIRMLVDRA